jgi:AcrR family transcriptional regulator
MARRGRPPLTGRREEILDAAVRVLGERGIEGLSLAQLAEALGFSTYALTYHFGAKEDVLAAVAEHVEARLQAEFTALAEQLSQPGQPEQLSQPGQPGQPGRPGQAGPSIPELVRQYWAISQQPGASHSMRLWLELVLLASRDPDRLPGFLDRAVSGWLEVVRTGLGDHPDADVLAPLAFAAITGLELLQLMQPGSAVPSLALEKLIVMYGRELP